MGCCQVKNDANDTMDKSSIKPDPIPFAIMRNGHEVIRGLMIELDEAAQANNETKFAELWKVFIIWMNHHAAMEDGKGRVKGFFAVLNENFNNIAVSEGLEAHHSQLNNATRIMEGYFYEKDYRSLISNWSNYRKLNEKHLIAEEEIMMPKVQEMHKLGFPIKKNLAEDIVSAAWDEVNFGSEFVQVACWVLEKHHGGMPRARVFIHALKSITDEQRWAKWLPYVKAGLSPEQYFLIDSQIELSSAGN